MVNLNPDLTSILASIISRICEIVDPEKIILFGSVSRGDNNSNSDIDLLVIKSGDCDPITLIGDIYVHLHGIRQAVDILLNTPGKLKKEGIFRVQYAIMQYGKAKWYMMPGLQNEGFNRTELIHLIHPCNYSVSN